MSNRWLSAKELMKRWDILPFELLTHCKKGLKPYDKNGAPIIDIDSIKDKVKHSYIDFEKALREKHNDKIIESLGWALPYIQDDAKILYHQYVKTELGFPKECILESLIIPVQREDADEFIEYIKGWMFKVDAVNEFERKYRINIAKGSVFNKSKSVTDNSIIDLVVRVKPEIEKIYASMKENVGFSGREVNSNEKLKAAALEEYENNRGFFKVLKRKHLEEKYLYTLNPGKSKRDFFSRILKMIVRDYSFGKQSGHKLFEQYKSIPFE